MGSKPFYQYFLEDEQPPVKKKQNTPRGARKYDYMLKILPFIVIGWLGFCGIVGVQLHPFTHLLGILIFVVGFSVFHKLT